MRASWKLGCGATADITDLTSDYVAVHVYDAERKEGVFVSVSPDDCPKGNLVDMSFYGAEICFRHEAIPRIIQVLTAIYKEQKRLKKGAK